MAKRKWLRKIGASKPVMTLYRGMDGFAKLMYLKFGHYAYRLMPLIWVAFAAEIWLPTLPEPWRYLEVVPLLVTLGGMVTGMMHGDYYLCEKCMSGLPLNAQELAAEGKERFRTYHFRRRWFYYPWFIGTVLALAGPYIALKGWRGETIQSLSVIPMALWYLRFSRFHQDLQIWCPWCHPRRPPEDDETVTPQPDPSVGQPA